MPSPNPIRGLLIYALIGTPIAVLVFLLATQFFVSWDGHAVSVVPPPDEEVPRTYQVLVVEKDGSRFQTRWPGEIVVGLDLPRDALAIPPTSIPDTAPHTVKWRYTLHYLVERDGGAHDVVPTTNPQALGLAALVWLLGLFLRNMAVAGSPIAFTPRPVELPKKLAAHGQVEQRKAISKKTAPAPKKRGGKKRRRR